MSTDQPSAGITSDDNEFLERLVFAEDRLKALDELLPKGSEDWYFYRLLTLQTQYGTSSAKDAKLLAATLDKLQYTGKSNAQGYFAGAGGKRPDNSYQNSLKIKNLLLRQALVDFYQSTGAIRRQTIVRVKNLLRPNLEHTRNLVVKTGLAPPGSYSSSLAINTSRILKKKWDALNLSKEVDVSQVFTSAAKEFLGAINLSTPQIGYFLDLLKNEAPEAPYLLTHIKKDIENNKTPFGTRDVHYRLTKQQLELLGKKSAFLNSNEEFLKAYALKLKSVNDANLVDNQEERGKYLERLKKFALEKVPTAETPSLQAILLYNYMQFLERRGKYEKDTFKAYLRIPKRSIYNERTMEKAGNVRFADLDYVIDRIPELSPIGDDEPFVRRAFRYFFRTTADSVGNYKGLVDQSYLKPLFAEVKLLAGNNEPKIKTLYNECLGYRNAYDDLEDRVDVELLPTNRKFFTAADAVVLKLLIKNVQTLTVRVYEINAKNYYSTYKEEVTPAIPVDGLAPFVEITKNYTDPRIMARERSIDIPQLKNRRGVFLVDFLGNGQQARALVRKGELRFIQRQEFADEDNSGAATYVFRLFNELNQEVRKGSIWIEGEEYYTDKAGRIFVPHAKVTNSRAAVILDDKQRPGSATLHFINYRTETFALQSGLFIDRENLLEREQAKIIVRSTLFMNEEPVSISFLENPQLTIYTINEMEEEVTRVLNVTLYDDRETVAEFTVPTEARKITISLSGSVTRASSGESEILTNIEEFVINDVDNTPAIGDLHLIPRGAAGYAIYVAGKNAEPFANEVVKVWLTHRYFQKKLAYTLQSNEEGMVFLGRLPDVVTVEAMPTNPLVYAEPDSPERWDLLEDKVNVPPVVNVEEGTTVRIPFMSASSAGPQIDVYDAGFIREFQGATYRNGYVTVKSLPVGDYTIFIRDQQAANVRVHIAKGYQIRDGSSRYVISPSRIIELSEDVPLQIVDVKGNREKGYKVQLEGFNKNTRVHCLSTYLVPRFTSYSFLAAPNSPPDVLDFNNTPAVYTEQSAVSVEFNYVLERKAAQKVVGNLLDRPSLLLASWCAVPPAPPQPAAPTAKRPNPPPPGRIVPRYNKVAGAAFGTTKTRNFDGSNLEFLANPSCVQANLQVDAQGWVEIPPESITSNLVQIIAVDDDNTSLRNVILPEAKEMFKDVRLVNGLPTDAHFTEVREILVLPNSGDTCRVRDWATSEMETYDDITDVFDLYRAIAAEVPDTDNYSFKSSLEEFRPITEWATMAYDAKIAFYDQYFSNELNFFLSKKDRDFFDKVAKPYIANKMQKSFFDLYLLDDDKALGEYVALEKYNTLNAFEKILLAERVPSVAPSTLRYLKESAALLFGDIQGTDRLFKRAVVAKQMSVSLLDAYLEANPGETTFQRTAAAQAAKKTSGFKALGAIEDAVYKAYAPFDKTEQRQETRYFRVPFEATNADLIRPSPFWADFAEHLLSGGSGPFLSANFGKASNNMAESLIALGLLDLPFRSQAAGTTLAYDGQSATITTTGPTILLSKQLKETEYRDSSLSVSTNYFDPQDRTEIVDGEEIDKFIPGNNFVTGHVYGSRIVITNVTSFPVKTEVLAQIPTGSIACWNGFTTKNFPVEIAPYNTEYREFFFYWSAPGEFSHYPSHVAKNGFVVGYGLEEASITVLDPEHVKDVTSWYYFSQKADPKDLLSYLKKTPDLQDVNLSDIAWRMKDEKFFIDVTTVLRNRQIFNDDIWAYSMMHFAAKELTEYLALSRKFAEFLKPHFSRAQICGYDAFQRLDYHFAEYFPLVNARAHGAKVANQRFLNQYNAFLNRALFRSFSKDSLKADDKLSAIYYFLLQDRVGDAQALFRSLDAEQGRTVSEFNYDYLKAYLSFYSGDINAIQEASNLADAYLSKPLPPSKAAIWQELAAQLNEIKDSTADGGCFQLASAVKDTTLDARIEGRRVIITTGKIKEITVNFYKIDLELFFSTNPFAQLANAYNFVTPNESLTKSIADEAAEVALDIPFDDDSNFSSIIEIIGAPSENGKANLIKALTDYDNDLTVEVAEAMQQIRVSNKVSGKPLSKAYIKVYGRDSVTGDACFFKDGYTDLRGRFAYGDISTDLGEDTDKFAVLVATESAGSTVIEI